MLTGRESHGPSGRRAGTPAATWGAHCFIKALRRPLGEKLAQRGGTQRAPKLPDLSVPMHSQSQRCL